MHRLSSFSLSACSPIDNCMVPTCTGTSDVTCKLCRSEFNSEQDGFNAFVGKPSNRRNCESKLSILCVLGFNSEQDGFNAFVGKPSNRRNCESKLSILCVLGH